MAYNYNNNILPAEKTIAVLSYLSFGFVGFIWIVLGAFLKQNLKQFLKYHIYQSIFLSILFFIVSNLIIMVLNLLGFIPFVNAIIGLFVFYLSVSLFSIGSVHFSIIQLVILGFMIYLSTGVIKGKYTFVPWVSNIIKYNIGRG